jgi:hypothetical protein
MSAEDDLPTPPPPPLPEVEQESTDDILAAAPSIDEIIEAAEPVEDVLAAEPSVDELLGRDRDESSGRVPPPDEAA